MSISSRGYLPPEEPYKTWVNGNHLTATQLPPDRYKITARYSGDAAHAESVSSDGETGDHALETIKVLLGLGDPLVGRLVSFDALEQSFRTFKLHRDPACPACRREATIRIADYDEYCLPHASR